MADTWKTTKIWEAGRATSAATSFFDPITFSDGTTYLDGATGANNPIDELWTQADDTWGPLPETLKCLVSIGTGVPALGSFGAGVVSIMTTLAKIATDTQATVERFENHNSKLIREKRYFRFNVTRGLETVELQEVEKEPLIIAATASYLGEHAVLENLEACVEKLMERECAYNKQSA